MKAKIVALDGKDAGSVELNEAIFGLEVRKDILHRIVEWQRAKARAGTHKTKTISEVSGTTAKPWNQKGGGRARQGSKRSTQWVGGGRPFGPVVRSHDTGLTKKFRKLALRTALSAKQAEGKLIIIADTKISEVKTKAIVEKFAALGWQKPLIIDQTVDAGFAQAARNIKFVDVLPEIGINVRDILKHQELVLTKAALDTLQERLA